AARAARLERGAGRRLQQLGPARDADAPAGPGRHVDGAGGSERGAAQLRVRDRWRAVGAGPRRAAVGGSAVREAQLDHRGWRGFVNARRGTARLLLRVSAALALLQPAASALAADAATDAARLKGRLEPAVEASVLAIADSARAAGLPTSPLVARALEG